MKDRRRNRIPELAVTPRPAFAWKLASRVAAERRSEEELDHLAVQFV